MGRVTVIGAGVVGLSCAVRLLEAGHRVDVVARDLPLETTSAVAAAIWYPYRIEPQERVSGWSEAALRVFADLARDEATGVRMVPGTEVHRGTTDDPWWAGSVPALARTTPPAGFADAWSFTTPVIEMPVYLRWLHDRVEALGGTITRMNLGGLPTPPGVLVNCSGLGARLLGADHAVEPVAGQVLYLEQFGLDRWWLHGEAPTYVVPREHEIVVGGTDDEGEWSRTPQPATTERILARAAELVPQVREARVLRQRVGLRPARPTVRLERVGDAVHCYGHGGAGVTVSWGCADEVLALVEG